MAEVIRLQERLDKMPRRHIEPCEARILLFTGIRYERLTDENRRPETRSNGTKRKKH
ncbi:MAG: hypothetical protein KDJ87_16555 [Rhizobiaceae bacterium]|nr:hypothetical protein [Rhizobiaceae bacterium]